MSKHFYPAKGEPFHAVAPVDLDVRPGGFVSVVGACGCGKSTLMLMTAGLLKVSHGAITIAGRKASGMPVTDIGIAFQDHLLLDFRTTRDNVLLQADIRGLDRKHIARRADELFTPLNVSAAVHRYSRQRSGRMRQRVSIGRAVVHNPSILMIDEPSGALDSLTHVQVRRDLEALWMDRRPTAPFIRHGVEEAIGLSDRRVFFMSPNPGYIVDDITIYLPRPRPLALNESSDFDEHAPPICDLFERLGVLRDHTETAATGVFG